MQLRTALLGILFRTCSKAGVAGRTTKSGLYTSRIGESGEYTVNFLKHLFSRHRPAESESSALVNWPGQTGTEYPYTVFPMDAPFQSLPGNFIYAKQAEDGGWLPIYMAQTRDLHQRLEGHVTAEDAIANGATHLHAHYDSLGRAARSAEEHDLILRWHPVCNEQAES